MNPSSFLTPTDEELASWKFALALALSSYSDRELARLREDERYNLSGFTLTQREKLWFQRVEEALFFRCLFALSAGVAIFGVLIWFFFL